MTHEQAMQVLPLKFTNSDARPKITTLYVRADCISEIMIWYGAHYAGDHYTVHVNGVKIAKDQDGWIVGDLPQEVFQ